jgi:hypothetical protein
MLRFILIFLLFNLVQNYRLNQAINADSDSITALVRLLAKTPLYNTSYPFVLINGTKFSLTNQYLNYTPVIFLLICFLNI